MFIFFYRIDQNVVQFQITMDYVVLMKIVKCEQKLFNYHLYLALWKGSIVLHVSMNIPATLMLKDKVNILLVLVYLH